MLLNRSCPVSTFRHRHIIRVVWTSTKHTTHRKGQCAVYSIPPPPVSHMFIFIVVLSLSLCRETPKSTPIVEIKESISNSFHIYLLSKPVLPTFHSNKSNAPYTERKELRAEDLHCPQSARPSSRDQTELLPPSSPPFQRIQEPLESRTSVSTLRAGAAR